MMMMVMMMMMFMMMMAMISVGLIIDIIVASFFLCDLSITKLAIDNNLKRSHQAKKNRTKLPSSCQLSCNET